MPVPYIISRLPLIANNFDRRMDPIFALSVGIAAFAVRVNREEKEKGHTTEQTIESFKRRWALVLGKEVEVRKEGSSAG